MLAQGERIEYDAEEYVENPEAALYERTASGYVPPMQLDQSVTVLPDPSAQWRGKFVVLEAVGEPDLLYTCLRRADGSFGWAVVTLAP